MLILTKSISRCLCAGGELCSLLGQTSQASSIGLGIGGMPRSGDDKQNIESST